MEKLLFATNNAHKLGEVRYILQGQCRIISLREAGVESNPEENAPTLEGNALLKARDAFRLAQCPTIADDTGLEVASLGGAPGVLSARYAGEGHDDAANRTKLLESLRKHPTTHIARFRTVVAYIDRAGGEHLFEGIVEGMIIEEERGEKGFGYDALFVPRGETRTFAQMNEAEKNAISHRARAFTQFHEYLVQHPL